jgi:hypothetical protein
MINFFINKLLDFESRWQYFWSYGSLFAQLIMDKSCTEFMNRMGWVQADLLGQIKDVWLALTLRQDYLVIGWRSM